GTEEGSQSVFEDDLLLGPNPAEARSFVFSSFLNEAATATLPFKEKEEGREPDTHSHGHRARIVCLHIDLFYFGKQPMWDDGRASPLPRNDDDSKRKTIAPTSRARSGLDGVGLTREKALLGAVGGSLGVWGIFTAAVNLQKAEEASVGSRSFVWKQPSTLKEEGGGLSGPGLSLTPQGLFPLAFVTYLARFLLNFDSSVSSWWDSEVVPAVPSSYSKGSGGETLPGRGGGLSPTCPDRFLLPPSLPPSPPPLSPHRPLHPGSSARQRFLMSRFGELSTTVELGLGPFASKGKEGVLTFCQRLVDRYIGPESEAYPRGTPEGRRIREQLALLFSLLPPTAQPTALINELLASLPPPSGTSRIFQVESLGAGQSKVLMDQTVRGMGQDPLMLLPARNMVPFAVGDSTKEARGEQGLYYRVPGLQSVLEGAYYGKGSGDGADPGDGASPGEHVEGANVAPFPSSAIPISPFGPIAARPIMKERSLDLNTYLLFALAGAVGCAGTHSLVVPIDVVKTRAQTSGGGTSILEGVQTLAREEGLAGLTRGIEPTLLGYLFYGVTVYPGYEFFKRALNSAGEDRSGLEQGRCVFGWEGPGGVGPAAATQFHAPLVILAGALATVIACLGVCPAEALRIRMVANAESFQDTLTGAVEQEGGIPSLWDGFPPLLVRQVLFGMMKFLVFDSVGIAIFTAAPFLRESVASSLAVSLFSGAVAGVASAIVSQPADTILSRMNAEARPSVMEAVSSILAERGVQGLFVGLGTRCLWSGSIISGQFLLYDVFRNLLHVTSEDLAQYMDVIGSFSN
ncbi:mitochondrial phosphate carrier protein, partial [Nannochloropsis gaditana CCMP526]|uniref:mitochondrial phosphate carrier protein n=1 Tax=Nannochloropsis gaditana (strain CCMP526) TaxID=1093141 RepID=UPI00029F6224